MCGSMACSKCWDHVFFQTHRTLFSPHKHAPPLLHHLSRQDLPPPLPHSGPAAAVPDPPARTPCLVLHALPSLLQRSLGSSAPAPPSPRSSLRPQWPRPPSVAISPDSTVIRIGHCFSCASRPGSSRSLWNSSDWSLAQGSHTGAPAPTWPHAHVCNDTYCCMVEQKA